MRGLALLLVFILAVSQFGCERESGRLQASATRTRAENAGAGPLDLDGQPFDLWQGRSDAVATVLIFTRTDCPISNRYAPAVRTLCEQFQPEHVDFFLVYVDPRQDSDTVRKHLREFEYPCPGVLDRGHVLVAECQAQVTPEAVVFDAERKIVYQGRIDDLFADFGQSRSEATSYELADALAAVVNHRPVDQPRTKAVGCYIGDLE